MDNHYFHFTLGPVQGFVAQARRTRDFWAGSFLLSWLSGVAMNEVKRQGGKITFPIPADDYLAWIDGSKTQGEAPRQGGIPNRFKAFSARVPQDFNGADVAKTICAAWMALAEHIWEKDELAAVAAENTREIWLRQHQNFWEISWAITTDPQASSLLDQRKNWRSHYPQKEAGVKCMVMDGWQELSGATRPSLEINGQPTLLKEFWQSLRGHGARGMQTDLAEQEHLCALAYVKRRFVRHFASFKVSLDSGLQVSGWPLAAGIPSVSYMAAAHWLEKLVQIGDTEKLQAILEAATAVNPNRDEWESRIRCLTDACIGETGHGVRRQLLALDGNLFFQHVQDNARAYGYFPEHMTQLKQAVRKLKQAQPDFDEPLSPFYAVLLMDGDSLGAHMSDVAKQESISSALNAFTAKVPQVVESHNGFLIYAGGDDVLALLPLEDAMECAATVRQTYLDCFEPYPKIGASISAAIQYAHVKMPLGKILGDAHNLLDEVAKEGAGRDALAVRVWKPGGLALQWAQPWDIALADGQLVIEQLVHTFRTQDARHGTELSSKFFHKIGERFELLNPGKKADGSYDTPVLDEAQARSLLAVDFNNSAENRNLTIEQAKHTITPLLTQCRAVKRDAAQPDPAKWGRSPLLRADGALLVRFLAQKGVE
jgi:CRISPR-associated protein Cmr2